MNDAWPDSATDRGDTAVEAFLDEDGWQRECVRHQEEARRWWGRVDLAERHQEFDLATEAAQRARRHAGLALAAERHSTEQQVQRQPPETVRSGASEMTTPSTSPATAGHNCLDTASSVDARLAAIKARLQATASGAER